MVLTEWQQKRLDEIRRIMRPGSNDFWCLTPGEHMNMVDDMLEFYDQLKDAYDKLLAWAKLALIGAKHEACKFTEDDPDVTWHCCDWSEIVEEAKKIGLVLE